ncbi:unnamed protein product, partial [Amoebophrya sp. A25]
SFPVLRKLRLSEALRQLTLRWERENVALPDVVIGRSFFHTGCIHMPVVDIAGGGREGVFRFSLDQQGAETSPAKLILIYQGLYHDHSLDTIMQLHRKNQILADPTTKQLLESFPTQLIDPSAASTALEGDSDNSGIGDRENKRE